MVLVVREQRHQAARSQIVADVELRKPDNAGSRPGECQQHVALIGHDPAGGVQAAVYPASRVRPTVPFGLHREIQALVLAELLQRGWGAMILEIPRGSTDDPTTAGDAPGDQAGGGK